MGDYIILKSNGATNEYSFMDEVNRKINEGYSPVGGLSVLPGNLLDIYNTNIFYYQAMYKSEEIQC